jgi:lysophospholipid acyltransferase (LPLAT)-like uncharacterized protein
MKKLFRHPGVQYLLSLLVYGYIRLVFATSRIEIIRHKTPDGYDFNHGNAIYCFWHGRLLMMPCFRKTVSAHREMYVLISQHRDGRMISRTIRHFRLYTVDGSSSKGGSKAAKDILRLLEEGKNITITPDGPRGPAEKIAPGLLHLARMSGVPVIPVSYSSSRCIRLKSWDRFMVALPFSHIVFCSGTPVTLADETPHAMIQSKTDELQQIMDEITQIADHAAGHRPDSLPKATYKRKEKRS